MSVALLFDISGGELMMILIFVLLFFGAKGIPDIARGLGRFMRQVRDASNEVQREIQRGANEVQRASREHQRQVRSMVDDQPTVHVEPPAPAAEEPKVP